MEKMREFEHLCAHPFIKRCAWVNDDVLLTYHDNEYGSIRMKDEAIFEQICFAVMGSGAVLSKLVGQRTALSDALCGYRIDACARMDEARLRTLARRTAIPAAKALAVQPNAVAAQSIIQKHGSLFQFIYKFKQPTRLMFALKSEGFVQMGIATVTGLMKNLGIIEAHGQECFKKTHDTIEE